MHQTAREIFGQRVWTGSSVSSGVVAAYAPLARMLPARVVALGYCFYFIVVVPREQASRQETTGKTEATMELDEFLCERNLERYRRLANSSTHACEAANAETRVTSLKSLSTAVFY